MSDKSKIEWTDASWNPVTGCTKVSEGCRNCYAMKFAERWRGTPGHYFENGFDVILRTDKLQVPHHWKRPRKIFVNSMSDLFHPKVPFNFIDQVFSAIALSPHHTFQILTKRPERMLEWFNREPAEWGMPLFQWRMKNWPLPNLWIGVSVENQSTADERISLLHQTPAAIRFLSCEPLLGPLDLRDHFGLQSSNDRNESIIDWVIAGGESGPEARPMKLGWVRDLRDQCQAAGVAYFFKQWGAWMPIHPDCIPSDFSSKMKKYIVIDGMHYYRVGKKKSGRILDGRTWDETPQSVAGCI